MVFDARQYSILVVSSSEKFDSIIRPILSDNNCFPVTFATSIAAAKRATLENSYDFVIINSPLPDEFGTKFAIDVSANKDTVCLLIAKAELLEEIHSKVKLYGVYTLAKPTSSAVISQAVKWLAVTRERFRNLEKKTVTIEEKMEEIRIVNRAKWLLIDSLKMSEPDAHRYIEKQAMDRCVSKKQIAESIIKTYS